MQSANSAWEFEVMVRRAARRGWLDVAELLDTYETVSGTGARAGRVDLAAALQALRALPTGLGEVERLLVVPDLGSYPVATAQLGGLGRFARLSDDVLLLEATAGMGSLTQLAALLCALQREINEARTLAGEAWLQELAVRIAQKNAEAEAEANTTAAQHASEKATPSSTDVLVSELAFRWGTDPAAVAVGNAASGGALLPFLLGTLRLPDIDLHADFAPQASATRAQHLSRRIAASLAEMGFLQRPIHLWLGDHVVVDCLSPYCRELRPVLARWSTLVSPENGADPDGTMLSEDALYDLAADFVGQDPSLASERDEAERSVGILRHDLEGLQFETVDLGRIDPALCDARASLEALPDPAPVLVRLPLPAWDAEAELIRSLLDIIGLATLQVTLVLEGAVIGAPVGAVVVPHLLVPWTGHDIVSLPTAPLLPETLSALGAPAVKQGAVLAVACAELSATDALRDLRDRYAVAGVVTSGTGILATLHQSLWTGRLNAAARVSWCMVGCERGASGRQSLPSLSGLAATSCALLNNREPETSPTLEPTPTEPLPPEPPPARKLSPWAMRIKA